MSLSLYMRFLRSCVSYLFLLVFCFFFFFSSRRRHTRFDCDWSSDVCSSDLVSILPAASAQNMKASSASGLCARRIVRLAGTRASGGDLGRLDVEGLEVVLVLGVLGPPAGALRRFVPGGLGVRPRRPRRVAPRP